jgi:recombination protein RecA
MALGIGGSRVEELSRYTAESSGKTTLPLHIAAEAQKNVWNRGAFIDAEHALDPFMQKRSAWISMN